jgi:SAM-dependent methyltransferase
MSMLSDPTITRGWDSAYLDNPEAQLWSEEPIPIVDDILARGRGCCLDLGCGDGRHLLALQRGGLDVVGLDISATALQRADRLLRLHGCPAPLLLGDILALPFAAGTLDVVCALDVLGQVPDPRPVLSEAHRVLRPDGLLVVNLFALTDDTFGEGLQIAPNTFLFKETLFRYFSRSDVESLFAEGWESEIVTASWTDPPHGSFRPVGHTHTSHVVFARPA